MAREMKDSGIEWIGEIPEEWSITQLKRLGSIQNGSTPSKTEDNTYYSDSSGVPWIKAENLGTQYPIHHTAEYLTEDGCAVGRVFEPYTIFVCCIASVGKVGYSNVVCSCNQQINGITFNNLYYWKYGYYVSVAQETEYIISASGNVMKIINSDKQSNLCCPVPPFEEQRRIADFLDAECSRIDAVIEQTRASIEEYKKLKQSVITQAVTKGIRPGRKMKDSGIEWIGEIPEEWDVRRIKTIGTYRNGLTYTPEEISTSDEGTLVLRSSNIQRGKLCFDDNVYVSADVPDRLRVQRGDIILCSRNGSRELIGKCAIVEDDLAASFGAFMMMFRCSSPKYMYYILNSDVFKYYLSTFLTATINQLTGGNFGNMAVVYCSDIKEQQEIIDYLDVQTKGIDAVIGNKEHLLVELESYKKSLIYEYVTGKKEVV